MVDQATCMSLAEFAHRRKIHALWMDYAHAFLLLGIGRDADACKALRRLNTRLREVTPIPISEAKLYTAFFALSYDVEALVDVIESKGLAQADADGLLDRLMVKVHAIRGISAQPN